MSISIESANQYFSTENNVNASVWLKFPEQVRTGAIASAKRMFETELRRPMKEDEPPYFAGMTRREDLAVYEQALWLLLGTPWGDASNGDAISCLQGQSEIALSEAMGKKRERFSPEALRWLGWGGVVLVRS